jgi:hypothetical protein
MGFEPTISARVPRLNFPQVSTVCDILALYVTSSHISACCSRVQLHVLKKEFREVRGTQRLVSFCHACQVTVFRRKPRPYLRNSCFSPMQFRSSCLPAPITVLPLFVCSLCYSEEISEPRSKYTHSVFMVSGPGIFPQYVLLMCHLWHLSY